MDARFVYESRLFYPYYGQMRFVTNPSAPAVRHWAADYHVRLLDATTRWPTACSWTTPRASAVPRHLGARADGDASAPTPGR